MLNLVAYYVAYNYKNVDRFVRVRGFWPHAVIINDARNWLTVRSVGMQDRSGRDTVTPGV